MGSSRGAPRLPPRDVGPPGWGARGEPPGSPLVTSALPDEELEGSPRLPPRDVGPPGWGARGEPPGSPLVTSALPDGELEGSPPAPPSWRRPSRAGGWRGATRRPSPCRRE